MSILAIQWVWWFRSTGGLLMCVTSLFLICLVLLQRGRGGGLSGAFGGAGGQSAFGTKAADVFTKFTIGTAAVWIALCIGLIFVSSSSSSSSFSNFDAEPDTTAVGTSETENTDAGNALSNPLLEGAGTSAPDTTPPKGKTADNPSQNEATPESSETP